METFPSALEYEMKAQQYDIGMVGLGVMGRNLLLNMSGLMPRARFTRNGKRSENHENE
jgi:6-phosphogluconate dehydrogenase